MIENSERLEPIRRPSRRRLGDGAARLCNLAVPHLGTLLSGRRETGWFGLGLGVLSALVALHGRRHGRPIELGAGVAAYLVLVAASVVHPDALRPVAHGFARVGRVVGRIWTTALLAGIWAALVSPLALVLRLCRRRPLERTGAPGWHDRAGAGTGAATDPPRRRYERMY